MSKYARAMFLCAAFVAPAEAQQPPKPKILKIDLRVEGSEGWQTKASFEKGTISEHFYLATVLEPSDSLDAMNPLDPDSFRKAQEQSARQNANMRKIQERNRALAPAAPQNPAMQQQMNQAIMQAYAKCKGDEACIKAAVMQSNPGLMTPPPSAMMKPDVPAASDDSPDEPKAVYRQYFGLEGCPGRFSAMRNDVSKGSVADVGASRPWNHEVKFDVARTEPSLCLSYPMSVVDEEAGKLYLQGFSFPNSAAFQKNVAVEHAGVPGEIAVWVAKTLNGAPLSGMKTETLKLNGPIVVLPIANAAYSGSVKITLAWSFKEAYTAGAALPDRVTP